MSDAAIVIAEILGRGHTVRFQASGDSMHPLIRSNDHLLVEPVDPSAIRRGDVVLARLDRGLTAHRVVRVDAAGTITTRGDNAPAEDPPFGAAQLLGRVVSIERDGVQHRVRRMPPPVFGLRRLARALRIRATAGRPSRPAP